MVRIRVRVTVSVRVKVMFGVTVSSQNWKLDSTKF